MNNNLYIILKLLHQEGHQTILLTNSHSGRAISLCKFYNLTKYFSQRYFYEDCLDNKYELLKSLGVQFENVVLFENEKASSSEAVTNGINLDKIIKSGILKSMEQFLIKSEASLCRTKEGGKMNTLKQDVVAFYHSGLSRGGNWRVPGSIENLICTFKMTSSHILNKPL